LNPAAAFLVALAGNALLSLGMVLQKRNIAFIGHRGERDAAFGRKRIGWISGFTLLNMAPVFNFVALLGLPSTIVAAASGSNVAFTALFSALLLGERIGPRSLALTALMFGAIALAGLRGGAGSAPAEGALLLLFLALPLVATVFAILLRRKGRSEGLAVLIGGLAGALGGFMILPMKAIQSLASPTLAGWLGSPWLYCYLIAGASSFSVVQLAYKDGRMTSVSPAFYGLQMLWPALASYFVFAAPFDAVQAGAFTVIALCVVLVAGQGRPPADSGPLRH
jgi:drug/metabolite transporter (DMT)-like permease